MHCYINYCTTNLTVILVKYETYNNIYYITNLFSCRKYIERSVFSSDISVLPE